MRAVSEELRRTMISAFYGREAPAKNGSGEVPISETIGAELAALEKAGKKMAACKDETKKDELAELRREMMQGANKVFALLGDLFADFAGRYPTSNMAPSAARQAADSYLSGGQFDKAIVIYEGLSAGAPEDAEMLSNYAWALLRQGKNLEKARSLADKLLKLSPENVDAMDIMAEIEFALGRPEQAVEWCEKALKLAPETRILNTRLLKYKAAVEKKQK